MEAIHQRIQNDLLVFGWVAFLVAIPLFAFLRQRDPSLRWHAQGQVATQSFQWIDLAVVVIFFLGLKLLVVAIAPEAPTPDATNLTTTAILTDILAKIAMASFLIFWLVIRRMDLVETFGLARLNLQATLIWGGVVGILAVPLVMAVGHEAKIHLEQFVGTLPEQPIVAAFKESADTVFKGITMIGVVLITPVFEELFYRGYLYGVTKRFSDRFFATFFSCLIFTVAHSGVITLLPIFTLAVFLVLAYELSGSLWVPILIHIFFNLVNVIGMLVIAPTA